MTDEEIMEQVCIGDRESFDTLFNKHIGYVISRAVNYHVVGWYDKEDVAQDVFMSLYLYKDTFTPKGKLFNLLDKITHNLILLRHRKSTGRLKLEHKVDDAYKEWAVKPDNPEDATDEKLVEELLNSVSAKFPPSQKEIFLRWANGESQIDIAIDKKVSPQYVNVALKKAQKKARSVYASSYKAS